MQDKLDTSVILSLKQLLYYCRQMQEMLKNDQQLFRNNNLTSIHESNQGKEILINDMRHIFQELARRPIKNRHGILLQDLENNASDLNPSEQKELLNVIHELKSEVSNCYHHLLVNSKVVYSNLQHTKYIWDKLFVNSNEESYTYDEKGKMNQG